MQDQPRRDLFLLSGLGADKRVFNFLDLSRYNTHFVAWIAPERGEGIASYARRLSRHIESTNPVLLGVSFGGMMAIEMAKHLPVEKIILISSAKTKQSIPSGYFMRRLSLHRLLPKRFILRPNELIFWLFGVHTKDERNMLRSIMADTDEHFFRWAIDQIIHWDNEIIPANTIHIHGSRDRIIPFTSADYRVTGGGHLMIVNRAREIDAILNTIL